MPDLVKQFMKGNSHRLEPGESVLGVLIALPEGTLLKKGAAVGVGGLLGAAIALKGEKKRAQEVARTAQGEAASWPGVASWGLALTDRRLLVLNSAPRGLKKAGDPSASYPLDRLGGIDLDKGKLVNKLTFRFTDGTGVMVDVGKFPNPDDFVGAFRRVRGG